MEDQLIDEIGFESHLHDILDEESLAPGAEEQPEQPEEPVEENIMEKLGELTAGEELEGEEQFAEDQPSMKNWTRRTSRSQVNVMTIFDRAAIMTSRAAQLENNYPPLIDLSENGEAYYRFGGKENYPEWYARVIIDPVAIARMELELGALNEFEVYKKFPDNTYEVWKVGELQFYRR